MDKIKFDKNKKNIQVDISIDKNEIIKECYIYSDKELKMYLLNNINSKIINQKICDNNCSIYFLINEYKKTIYVGKSKSIFSRLQNHNQNKDFTRIILFNNDNWTQVTIDYLEYWFINFFKNNDVMYKLENSKNENEPKCAPHDEQIIEKSLNIIKWLLLIENIKIDSETENNFNDNNKINEIKDVNVINSKIQDERMVYFKNIEAIYCKSKNKITLQKGTKIIWSHYDLNKYDENSIKGINRYNNWFLNNQDKIEKINQYEYILKTNIILSPSFAACLVCGRFSQSGNQAWKTKNNININNLYENEFSLDENFNPTNEKPKYIKIDNKKIEMESWVEIWKYIVEYLFKLNKNKIFELSAQKWPNKNSIYLTNNKQDLRSPYEISQNKIYIEQNLSAITILKNIKNILENLNHDLKNYFICLV